MDTEKTCLNCKHYVDIVDNFNIGVCSACYSHKRWEPSEDFTKEYMERCLPGESAYDMVNKPKHYMLFEDKGIEVRDVLAKLSSKIRLGECTTVPCNWDDGLFVSDYVQLMQYLMRFMDKNGLEDLKKARFYLDKLIESY